jgi:antitoxin MazE
MNQHVKKWGNSLAVRIPAPLSSEIGLKEDDAVEVRAEDGRLVIEKRRCNHPTLDQLLDGVTPENVHEDTDWGPRVGRESW